MNSQCNVSSEYYAWLKPTGRGGLMGKPGNQEAEKCIPLRLKSTSLGVT